MQQKKIIVSTLMPEQFEKFRYFFTDDFKLYNLPMIYTQKLDVNHDISKVMNELNTYNWLIFTSKRGVTSFFELYYSVQKQDPPSLKIACIGKSTGEKIEEAGYKVEFLNPGNTSLEFAEHFIREKVKPVDNILLVQGKKAGNELQEILQAHCLVKRIDVYETIDCQNFDEDIKDLTSNGLCEYVVFTSPSSFENFIRLGRFKPGRLNCKIASIGNRTTKSIESMGYQVSLTAKEANLENLAKEICLSLKPRQISKHSVSGLTT